jgi:hypothetical protein
MADNNTSNGIGVGTTLFIVFLVLKLTNTIDWSWWWVTSPLWIPVALGIVILGVVGMLMGASGKFKK